MKIFFNQETKRARLTIPFQEVFFFSHEPYLISLVCVLMGSVDGRARVVASTTGATGDATDATAADLRSYSKERV